MNTISGSSPFVNGTRLSASASANERAIRSANAHEFFVGPVASKPNLNGGELRVDRRANRCVYPRETFVPPSRIGRTGANTQPESDDEVPVAGGHL